MPRDDADDWRMTRQVLAALMMSSLCSGTGGRGIADQRLDMLAGDATNAADALIAKLEADEHAERKVYQQRRMRFEGEFVTQLTMGSGPGTSYTIEAVHRAWKAACKQVEPEFFPELRT